MKRHVEASKGECLVLAAGPGIVIPRGLGGGGKSPQMLFCGEAVWDIR